MWCVSILLCVERIFTSSFYSFFPIVCSNIRYGAFVSKRNNLKPIASFIPGLSKSQNDT